MTEFYSSSGVAYTQASAIARNKQLLEYNNKHATHSPLSCERGVRLYAPTVKHQESTVKHQESTEGVKTARRRRRLGTRWHCAGTGTLPKLRQMLLFAKPAEMDVTPVDVLWVDAKGYGIVGPLVLSRGACIWQDRGLHLETRF